ncbi:lecithin retinol acyltransferase family protein [Teredinibacter purpureus]|uniref:lecithin retinol acyltransferase family protein n=1 Tax=Teredinibacter purpureus TaxID=2731756 RepID=UPI0005F78743|nr:lecithin retinol acyltransferase family protein [Teredinibacter purpureus]
MNLQQIDVTGCRIVGAITKELGHAGPKHHGVILGKSEIDREVYIAESMNFGYQACTYSDFYSRYSKNGQIIVQPNDGQLENVSVAQRAIEELRRGGKGAYDLITNNCECFVNRAMHDKSISSQVINTAIGITVLAGLVYVIKNAK